MRKLTAKDKKRILLAAARDIEAEDGRHYRQDRLFCGSAGCLSYHIAKNSGLSKLE